MAYIVILINIAVNWAVIFFLTGLAWSLWNYPGDRMVMYVSGCITFALILLGLSSIGERMAVTMLDYRLPNIYEQYFILPQLTAVCQVAEVPIPALYINECLGHNARALGRHSIIVNSGVVDKIPLEELRGILAHELGHLEHKDTARLHMIFWLNFVGNCTAFIAAPMTSEDNFEELPIILAPFIFMVWVVRIIQVILLWFLDLGDLAVGRKEELRADQYAKDLGYGEGLAQYLRKQGEFKNQSDLFRTHPPKQVRLDNLTSQ